MQYIVHVYYSKFYDGQNIKVDMANNFYSKNDILFQRIKKQLFPENFNIFPQFKLFVLKSCIRMII